MRVDGVVGVAAAKALAGVFLVLAVGGCSAPTGPTKTTQGDAATTKEQQVMSRVQQRWNLLLAKDLDKAYEYLSPAARLTMSKEVYRLRVNPTFWRGAKVKSAACRDEVCDVQVELNIMVLPNLPVDQVVEEKWILDQGQWWFVYQG